MKVKHFKNSKTGQVQRAVEGSRLYLLMDDSDHFTEVDADGTAKAETKGDGDGAGDGGRRRGPTRKAADGRGAKQS